jgi:DNA repair photolyase
MSGVTDPYQPIERRLKITRGCLEVLAEFRNPVSIVTKNQLVTRDLDLLGELAGHNAAAVYISLTTLDTELRKVMEPRTAPPAARLATITALAKAGVPVGALISPVIPGLNDYEIPSLVQAAFAAGARFTSHVMLRLPHAVAPLFEQWLEHHFPNRKEKVLNRLRAMRGGKLYEAEFGKRMRGEGTLADQIDQLSDVACRKAGIAGNELKLSTAAFRRRETGQLELFC